MNLVSGVIDRDTAKPRPHLDIQFYNYGSLYFYLWQVGAAANQAYGIVQEPQQGTLQLLPADTPPSATIGALLKVGRLLNVLLGTMTVWAVFALANRLFGHRAGLIAGSVYAIVPVAVVHAHYATVDVSATFFITLALVFGARLLAREERSGKREEREVNGSSDALSNFQRLTPDASTPVSNSSLFPLPSSLVLTGLFCGLAAATKYNSVLVLLAPLAAVFFATPRPFSWGRLVAQLGTLIGMAALGFVIGCPGVLLNWPLFQQHFLFELHKSGEGMGLLFADTGNGWLYHLRSSMRFGMGMPLLLLALAATSYALYKRKKADWYLLAFALPYYLVIGYAQVRFLRYILPLMPILSVFIGRLVTVPYAQPVLRRLVPAIAGVVGVVTLLLSLALDRTMTLLPPQEQALEWIQRNVPNGARIGFVTIPWYYSPPLSPSFTMPTGAPKRRQAAQEVTAYHVLVSDGEWDSTLLAEKPNYFVVSDVESGDAKRINFEPARSFFTAFQTDYTPTVFENTPSLFGIDFGKPDYVPNDWLYIYPRVTIYKRK